MIDLYLQLLHLPETVRLGLIEFVGGGLPGKVWMYGTAILQGILCLVNLMFWDKDEYWIKVWRVDERDVKYNGFKLFLTAISCILVMAWEIVLIVSWYILIIFIVPISLFVLFRVKRAITKKLDKAFLSSR